MCFFSPEVTEESVSGYGLNNSILLGCIDRVEAGCENSSSTNGSSSSSSKECIRQVCLYILFGSSST